MKFSVRGIALSLSFLFLGFAPAFATQNFECENDNSPFSIEVGVDTAFVINKRSFEVEKVLPQIPSQVGSHDLYESEGGDWSLKLSKNRKVAFLRVGDSDEVVPFSCSL